MTTKIRAEKIMAALKEKYPEAPCALTSEEAWQLLIAVRLSAQCTDKRVNMVTPALFAAFPTLESMAAAPVEEIEAHIRSCGLYQTKARDIKAMCGELLTRFHGKVPDTIEELTTLPGVGRKTANLIVSDVYGKPGVVVDTHFIRLSNRFGLTKSKDPAKIEVEMKKVLPPEESAAFCHRIVLFGRECCTARAPQCDGCVLREWCKEGAHAGH